MTFIDKKIAEFEKKFIGRMKQKTEKGFLYINPILKSSFENWLKQTIAEAETSGLNKAISYLNETQQKYKDDTKSLLCDYTLRKMIKDLKELPACSADREQE